MASIPVHRSLQACRGPPVLTGTPKRDLGRGAHRTRDRRGRRWIQLSMALASPQKRRGARGGEGVPKAGGGVSAPPPVGRSRSPLSSVALYPGEETGAQGLRSERSEGGDHCKIGAAAVAGET